MSIWTLRRRTSVSIRLRLMLPMCSSATQARSRALVTNNSRLLPRSNLFRRCLWMHRPIPWIPWTHHSSISSKSSPRKRCTLMERRTWWAIRRQIECRRLREIISYLNSNLDHLVVTKVNHCTKSIFSTITWKWIAVCHRILRNLGWLMIPIRFFHRRIRRLFLEVFSWPRAKKRKWQQTSTSQACPQLFRIRWFSEILAMCTISTTNH